MRTFSQLLREYIARTGVSDAELARAVGVQRQTVFRWKEGQVARPRTADDVLRLAAKLRLTPAERDELLLAAGFAPVAPARPSEPAMSEQAGVEVGARTPARLVDSEGVLTETVASPAASPVRRWLRWIIAGAALLLLAAAAFALVWQQGRYPRAAAGERLIVVAQFGNYTGGAQGYNIAGRLVEALERELTATGLEDARLATWPVALTGEQAAAAALQRSGAALLIWGEYDSGRVVARFLPAGDLATQAREVSLQAATPAELPTVINSTLPGDIRYLALYTLAQIYLHEGHPAPARTALGQAGLHLPADKRTQAAYYFLWGYANQAVQPPDLERAIQGYTDALRLDEGLEAAYNNRAVAYLQRRAPGDVAGVTNDLTRYLALVGDDPAAYNNRGSAYFLLGGADNLARALADFDRAIELAPGDPAGYYNRGLVYVRLDNGPKWRADLERALELGHQGAHEGLCWGNSLSEEPAAALGQCEAALKGAGPGPLENLAVAYARTGQYAEAADALRKFRDELGKATGGAPAEKAAQIETWLAALDEEKNPFDAEALKRLREE